MLTLADLFAAIEAAPELRKVILSNMLLPYDEHFDSSYIISSIQRHGHDFALPSFTLGTLESNLSQEQIRNIAKFCSITQISSLSIEVSHWYIELAVGDDCLSIKLPRVPVSSVPVLTGILQPILEIISPNSIISLSITDVTGFCQTFLALWPNVEQLTLNTWNTVDIVPFFDALSNSQNLLAPKLHDIRIIDDIEDLADEDTSPLVSFLRTREELGVSVKKLHLDQRRGLEAEVFDRLSRFTQVVCKSE
ncbi:hypothetical protein ONZ45_g14962 [Pleurotus djamor]|nr:hypothetical protein ONZ45_g14962 [Pleurotus djamor]